MALPVARDTCQCLGAETQPLTPAPGGNTTLSNSFLLQTHVYFANYSGVGSSLGELPSSFGKRHHRLLAAPSTLRS